MITAAGSDHPATPPQSVVDLSVLVAAVGPDEAVVWTFVDRARASCKTAAEVMAEAFAHYDAEAIRAEAHRARAAGGALGAPRLLSVLSEVEHAAADADWEAIRDALSQVPQALLDVELALADRQLDIESPPTARPWGIDL